MLLVCLLAIGFMVWFLIALVRDGRRRSAEHRLRLPSTLRAAWSPESPAATWRWLLPIIHFALLSRSSAQTPNPNTYQDDAKAEIQQLRDLVQELQKRIVKLESRLESKRDLPKPSAPQSEAVVSQPAAANQQQTITNEDRNVLDFFRGTTINLGVHGYYGYNFNRPAGRVNLLRPYDGSNNSFSVKQANIILEQAPDVASGKRFGARLDLQYGQATESSQGNAANELRPQAYRPIWQAFRTYVFPLGKGLTMDVGEWASPLGIETNQSKDQMNYFRSYLFNLMPFYHMGARATYQFNNAVTLGYAVVNGIQAEDFNGFKSQIVFLTLRPTKRMTWNINYYTGQEQRDVVSVLNPGFPSQPTQPGLPATPFTPTPDGRLHIVDSNVTWTATPRLTSAAEGDYVICVLSQSTPAHVTGGAGYARYQFTPKVAEYLPDRGEDHSSFERDDTYVLVQICG